MTDDEWLAQRVRALITDEEPIDPSENLMLYGIDSMQVMELALEIEARSIRVSFAELAETPTLAAWARLVAERRAA